MHIHLVKEMLKRPTIRTSYKNIPSVPRIIPEHSYLYQFVKPIVPIPYTPEPFVPHTDYEFIAERNGLGEEYINKSKEWFDRNPRLKYVAPPAPEQHDYKMEFIHKLRAKYHPHVPPLDAMEIAMKNAGYSDKKIQKYVSTMKQRIADRDKNQASIDRIFGKYPSASKPAPKKKVIKAVKKRTTA